MDLEDDLKERLAGLKKNEEELKKSRVELRELSKRLKNLLGKKRSKIVEMDEKIGEILRLRREISDKRTAMREKRKDARNLREKRDDLLQKISEIKNRLSGFKSFSGDIESWKMEKNKLELIYEISDEDPGAEKQVLERIRNLTKKISSFEEHRLLKEERDRIRKEIVQINLQRDKNRSEMEGTTQFIECVEEELKYALKTATDLQMCKDELDRELGLLKDEERKKYAEVQNLEIERGRIHLSLGIKEVKLSYRDVLTILKEKRRKTRSAIEKLSRKEALTLEEYAELVEKGLI